MMVDDAVTINKIQKIVASLCSLFIISLCWMSAFELPSKFEKVLTAIRSGERLTSIDLSNCSLTEIPPEVFSLGDSLELLNLGGNYLETVPDDVLQLKKLRILFFAQNKFSSIPLVLGSMQSLYMLSFKSNALKTIADESLSPSLGWLILTDNVIEVLPRSIGRLKHLRKLMLAGNRLIALPAEMASCDELELVRLAANNLMELPAWLVQLPRLSWIAHAGNSITTPAPSEEKGEESVVDNDVRTISWGEVELIEQIGEGASGFVHRAKWTQRHPNEAEVEDDTELEGSRLGPGPGREVAVKLFKGEATSDGMPEDEMKVCERAGNHPHCIKVLGRLTDVPNGVKGLVMELVPPSFRPLGGPPSFASVTRDTYPPDTVFPLEGCVKIARGVASVCAHLHARGISHGDIYAHNILIDNVHNPMLGDFGAASFYHVGSPQARDLQAIEVRAFGCLLEELLDRVPPTPPEMTPTHADEVCESVGFTSVAAKLRELQGGCMGPPNRRPTFAEISTILEGILL